MRDYKGLVLKWHSIFTIVLKELGFKIWRRQRKKMCSLLMGNSTIEIICENAKMNYKGLTSPNWRHFEIVIFCICENTNKFGITYVVGH